MRMVSRIVAIVGLTLCFSTGIHAKEGIDATEPPATIIDPKVIEEIKQARERQLIEQKRVQELKRQKMIEEEMERLRWEEEQYQMKMAIHPGDYPEPLNRRIAPKPVPMHTVSETDREDVDGRLVNGSGVALKGDTTELSRHYDSTLVEPPLPMIISIGEAEPLTSEGVGSPPSQSVRVPATSFSTEPTQHSTLNDLMIPVQLVELLRECATEPVPNTVTPQVCEHADLLVQAQMSYLLHYKARNEHLTTMDVHNQETFELQKKFSTFLTILVFAIVGIGLWLSYLQFKRDGTDEAGNVGHATVLKFGNVEISSPVIGLIILAMSMYFFERYITHVYTITPLQTTITTSK